MPTDEPQVNRKLRIKKMFLLATVGVGGLKEQSVACVSYPDKSAVIMAEFGAPLCLQERRFTPRRIGSRGFP
jgi:hypothetical protein